MPHPVGLRNAALPGRPVEAYRRECLELLLACSPSSVLDVGCGTGGLLRELAQSGVRATGVDVEAEAVAALELQGFDARLASAGHLPFEERSFDWVVMQYTAHHLAQLRLAMLEMWRVARRGVIVLDPWYDTSLVSQRVALALDRWSKRIDRQRGMVHADCLGACDILAPLPADATRVEVRHWLRLVPLQLTAVRELIARQLASVPPSEALRREADALLEHVERDGASEDGALFVLAAR